MILKGQLENWIWGRGQINKVFLGVNWNVCEFLDRQKPSAPIGDWLWSQIRCGAQSYCRKMKGSSQVTTWPLSSIQKCSFSVTQDHLHSPGVDQVLTKKRWETDGHAFTTEQKLAATEYKAGFSNYLKFWWKRVWSGMRKSSHLQIPLFMPKFTLCSDAFLFLWGHGSTQGWSLPHLTQGEWPERVEFLWFHKDTA